MQRTSLFSPAKDKEIEDRFMETKDDFPVVIRPGIESDLPLIYSTWLESFWEGVRSTNAKELESGIPYKLGMRKHIYFSYQRLLIDRLLQRSQIKCLCFVEDPNQVFAYSIEERQKGISVLHYLFTKFTYRRFGFARELMKEFLDSAEPIVYYSHRNQAYRYQFVIPWLEERNKVNFNPYLAV